MPRAGTGPPSWPVSSDPKSTALVELRGPVDQVEPRTQVQVPVHPVGQGRVDIQGHHLRVQGVVAPHPAPVVVGNQTVGHVHTEPEAQSPRPGLAVEETRGPRQGGTVVGARTAQRCAEGVGGAVVRKVDDRPDHVDPGLRLAPLEQRQASRIEGDRRGRLAQGGGPGICATQALDAEGRELETPSRDGAGHTDQGRGDQAGRQGQRGSGSARSAKRVERAGRRGLGKDETKTKRQTAASGCAHGAKCLLTGCIHRQPRARDASGGGPGAHSGTGWGWRARGTDPGIAWSAAGTSPAAKPQSPQRGNLNPKIRPAACSTQRAAGPGESAPDIPQIGSLARAPGRPR